MQPIIDTCELISKHCRKWALACDLFITGKTCDILTIQRSGAKTDKAIRLLSKTIRKITLK